MQIKNFEPASAFKLHTLQLKQKMLSPFCGLNPEIGCVNRGTNDQRIIISSAALYGIHVLFNRENPGKGAYHIGGTGLLPNEAMIKVFAETIERAAQLKSHLTFVNEFRFNTFREMENGQDGILSKEYFTLFSERQLLSPHFPFQSYQETLPLGWISMYDFYHHQKVWVPAQMVLVGYQIQNSKGEPWISSAVTTGTASHTTYPLACRSALLELIQLDSVMGHWYTKSKAYEINLDNRLATFISLLNRYDNDISFYRFYYLPNPDLPGFTVACVYLQDQGVPKVAMGLGSDFSLEQAIYKAYLEAVATIGLSRMLLVKSDVDLSNIGHGKHAFYNLDTNVAHFAKGAFFDRIKERFLGMQCVKASDLPPDIDLPIDHQIKLIRDTFIAQGKNLMFLDLTTDEEKKLGFKVVRVWSPQLLPLCLPSAVPIKHPRFQSYGGIRHDDPHPYP